MKRNQASAFALILGAAFLISVVASAAPQTQTQPAAGKDVVRYDGRIKALNKEAKTFTIQSRKGAVQIKYNEKTRITYRNKTASINDLREGRRVIVLLDPREKELIATRIDMREVI
jgi:hypothetical protein